MEHIELEQASPQAIIRWALREYAGRIALSCSFGGPTGLVALDMVLAHDPSVPVYFIDTGLLFPETYATVRDVGLRYGITPIAVRSTLSLDRQAREEGEALWLSDPDRCCALRKVEPQAAFLSTYTAWITGIRRDQTPLRGDVPVVQWDARTTRFKINPFARWSEEMVWAYVRAHRLPYNPLHDRGFPSIGCVPCTRAVSPEESNRAGRWPGSAKVECGLHV